MEMIVIIDKQREGDYYWHSFTNEVCVYCSEDAEEGGEPNHLECEDASGYLNFHKVSVGCLLLLKPFTCEGYFSYVLCRKTAATHSGVVQRMHS